MKKHAFSIFFSLIGLLFLAFTPTPKGKGMKGVLRDSCALFEMEEKKPLCKIDSGAGQVLYIHQAHENPLFPSKAENRVHLMLHFPDGILAGQRYTLPSPKVNVCYLEKGDLLMFKSFEGQGWVEFTEVAPGKTAAGKMDLKLIKPHHNMSNSDYHYMGGDFRLKWE